jgi:hypothetical protein
MSHAEHEGTCLGEQGCLICFRHIEFPSFVYDIFRGLLVDERPMDRFSAINVATILRTQPMIQNYERDFAQRSAAMLQHMLQH